MESSLWPLETFDRHAEFSVVERRLPHWSQAGCLCFITWRTYDSIPQSVLSRWHADREAWLRKQGIDGDLTDWKSRLLELDRSLQIEFVKTFSERWHRHLDSGLGACPLRDPELSRIVADSLHKFDGQRYLLTDFVIMPNHIHLLASFKEEARMLDQCESWKHFTAHEINKRLKQSGRLWQQDGFDHLVRTDDQFASLRQYIANNPQKANLKPNEWRHFSKQLDRTS
jgi:REP element-mobilizing transposase RayT